MFAFVVFVLVILY